MAGGLCQVPKTIKALNDRKIPMFGVCLGLQGIIEAHGGVLGQLPTPMHGKPSIVKVTGDMEKGIFAEVAPLLIQWLVHPSHACPCALSCDLATSVLSHSVRQQLPDEIMCGRYHSLFAEKMPDCLQVTAKTEDGCIMAVRHKTLPIAAVQVIPHCVATVHPPLQRQCLVALPRRDIVVVCAYGMLSA